MFLRFKSAVCTRIISLIVTQSFLLTNSCFALAAIGTSDSHEHSTLAPSLQINPVEFSQIISQTTAADIRDNGVARILTTETVVLAESDLATKVDIGTNGWRTRMDTGAFTINNVGRMGKAEAEEMLAQVKNNEYTPNNKKQGLRFAVCYDVREGSKEFAQRMIEVLSAYGIKVDDGSEYTTSPAAAALSREALGEDAYDVVIQITASHNDARYNGIKIFQKGIVAPDSLTKKFEKRANDPVLNKEYKMIPIDQLNIHTRDITQETLVRYNRTFNSLEKLMAGFKQKNPNFSLTVDFLYGSAIPFAAPLEKLGAKIVSNTPMKDGFPTNEFNEGGEMKPFRPEPKELFLNPKAFADFKDNAADGAMYVGIDGDGDRAACWIKINGKVVELKPNNLGVIYEWYLHKYNRTKGTIVCKTQPTSYGMDVIAKHNGKSVVVTPVGSKNFGPYVIDSAKEIASVAVEESGHVGINITVDDPQDKAFGQGETFFDDAVSQALLMLEIMAVTGKDLNAVQKQVAEEINYQSEDKRVNKNLTPELKEKITSPLNSNPRALADKIEFFVGKKAVEITVTTKDSKVIPLDVLEKQGVANIKANEGINLHFADHSWAQIRLSGTEPVARIYTQASTEQERLVLEKAVSSALDKGEALSPLELSRKLKQENFEQRLRALFGKTYEQALADDPYLASICYDLDDKSDTNRTGWSVEKLNWLLDTDEGRIALQKTIDDGRMISEKYKYVIFAGMGGSGLSVEFVKKTFGEDGQKMYSLRTTDPQVIDDILKEIAQEEGSEAAALKNTLIIPVSKSGTTEETVSHKRYFNELYGKHGLDVKKHVWVVTDKGSPFDTGDYEQRGIQLNGKGDIGGRYTAPTTNVFLLPLAITAPQRVKPILKIARTMNDRQIENDVFLNLGAYLYYMAAYKGNDKLTLIVPKSLGYLPNWFEQLLEESLGKDGKGITIFYEEDLTPEDLKPVEENDRVFVRMNLGAANQALWDYVKKNNYPNFEIMLPDLNSVGGVMLGFQRTVASIAYLWDICFVNQPAVQGYKKGTKEVMSALKPGEKVTVPAEWKDSAEFGDLTLYFTPLLSTGAITIRELKEEMIKIGQDMSNAPAVYAAILNILSRNPGFEAAEIMSYGRMTNNLRSGLQSARTNIYTKLMKIASKLGMGPDKNHSFHQNIEGGKDMWVSTYLMANQFEEPETLDYGDNLIKAQTIGTVKSLMRSGRKALLITSKSTMQAAESDVDAFFKNAEEYLQELQSIKTSVVDKARETYRYVSISMGGTKVAISLNDGNNNIIDYLAVKWADIFANGVANADADALMNLVAENINTILEKNNIAPEAVTKISSNLCGPVDKVNGIFGSEFAVPNLPIGDKYPFRAKLQEKLSKYSIAADVEMVNDAEGALKGETYSPKGGLDNPDGGVTIIGTGINSAVKKTNEFYAGKKGEFKEFGHNLVRVKDKEGHYHYQWVGGRTLGNHPIEVGNTSEEIIRKSGDKGKAYVADPVKFVQDNPDYPLIDWAGGDRDFEDRLSGPSIDKILASSGFKQYNVNNLTEKAAQGDKNAIDIIKTIGREVGEAHAPFFASNANEGFIKHWVLISGVNENLGKGIYEQGKTEDVYISSIRESLVNDLVLIYGIDETKATEIAAGMVRSNMTYERELVSYQPTDDNVMQNALNRVSGGKVAAQQKAASKDTIALVNQAI